MHSDLAISQHSSFVVDFVESPQSPSSDSNFKNKTQDCSLTCLKVDFFSEQSIEYAATFLPLIFAVGADFKCKKNNGIATVQYVCTRTRQHSTHAKTSSDK